MKGLDISRIVQRLESVPREFADRTAQVGWFPTAQYEDGTPVAYVAAIQEYGDPSHNIAPRLPMRATAQAQRQAWADLMAQGAKAAVQGSISVEAVLEGVGLQAAGDLRKAIATVSGPPLSKITLMLRKWRREGRTITGRTVGQAAAAVAAGESTAGVPTDPLRDTGELIATLTNSVGPTP